jgi:hypothetical protein
MKLLFAHGEITRYGPPLTDQRKAALKKCTNGIKFDSDRYVNCMTMGEAHHWRLSLKACGHAFVAPASSGQAWRLNAASTPACASDDLPTPELPMRRGFAGGHRVAASTFPGIAPANG